MSTFIRWENSSHSPQQIPDVEGEDDNATLKEAGYREDDIIDPIVNGKYCEEFNNYVTPDANVTQ